LQRLDLGGMGDRAGNHCWKRLSKTHLFVWIIARSRTRKKKVEPLFTAGGKKKKKKERRTGNARKAKEGGRREQNYFWQAIVYK